ncbi:MAG: ABC transporter substrate-binding protein [Pseudonocardia sp.]
MPSTLITHPALAHPALDDPALDDPTPIVDDVTRRQLLIGGASLAALLVGCGSSAPPAPPSRVTDGPTTIAHKYGSLQNPDRPQRVVTVRLVEQDALLALGVIPVAATGWFGEHPGTIFPWARDELGCAAPPEVLSFPDGIQFERVAALRPDLVLAVSSELTEQDYTRLSQIAPTVAQPADHIDYGVPWQELPRMVGRAVGRGEQAEHLVVGVEARFAAVRAAHPELAGAIAVTASVDDGYFVLGPQDPRGRLLTDLGFTLPAAIGELTGESYFAVLSREHVDLLDVDALVWIIDAPEQLVGIDADPLYNRLAVATPGRDIFVTGPGEVDAALSFQTVLGLPVLLDALEPQLAAVLDGDPATAAQS